MAWPKTMVWDTKLVDTVSAGDLARILAHHAFNAQRRSPASRSRFALIAGEGARAPSFGGLSQPIEFDEYVCV